MRLVETEKRGWVRMAKSKELGEAKGGDKKKNEGGVMRTRKRRRCH